MTDQWLGLIAALVTGVVLAIGFYGMRSDRPLRSQVRHFVCPISGRLVACGIVRDMRTGQFKQVEACSAFANPVDVRCDKDCAALMNLGLPLQGDEGRP